MEVESWSHEGDQRRRSDQVHYSFLREFNYIYLLKKEFMTGEDEGRLKLGGGRNSLRKVKWTRGKFLVGVRLENLEFISPSVQVSSCRRRKRRGSVSSARVERAWSSAGVGRLTQIGHGAPSVRWVCGSGYTPAKVKSASVQYRCALRSVYCSFGIYRKGICW